MSPMAVTASGSFQGETGREDREPAQQDTFLVVEQVVAPVQRGPERLVPRDPAPSPGEETKAVRQPLEQLGRSKLTDPSSRQLDRQRDAIEPFADTRHRFGRRGIKVEAGPGFGRPSREELHSLGARVERRNEIDLLARDAEGFTARRHHPAGTGTGEYGLGQLAARIDEVLTVVEEAQRRFASQVLRHPHDRIIDARAIHQPERPGRRVNDSIRIGDHRQVDEPHTVAELPGHRPGRLQRQPGLSTPPNAGQRDQPMLRHQPPDRRELVRPAHEHRGWGHIEAHRRGRQRREARLEALGQHLPQPHRRQTLQMKLAQIAYSKGLHEHRRRRRHQNLTGMRRLRDARRPVHNLAVVVAIGLPRRSRAHPHPHAQRHRPVHAAKSP
jgi:hypothetical protein